MFELKPLNVTSSMPIFALFLILLALVGIAQLLGKKMSDSKLKKNLILICAIGIIVDLFAFMYVAISMLYNLFF